MQKSELEEKVQEFSVDIIHLYILLLSKIKQYELTKQLLRSGTNIGAHIRESRIITDQVQSLQKITEALLAAERTKYWLDLLHDSNYLINDQYIQYQTKLEIIINLLKNTICEM